MSNHLRAAGALRNDDLPQPRWPYRLIFALVGGYAPTVGFPIAPVHAQRRNDGMWAGMVSTMLERAFKDGVALEITNYMGGHTRLSAEARLGARW